MRRTLAILGVLICMLGTSATPAGAVEKTTEDPLGGGSSYLDLYRVKVVNNAKGVRITVRMHPIDWVEFNPVGTFRLLIDTTSSTRGADFAEEFGLPGDGGFRALKGSKKKRKSWETYPFYGKCGKSVRERFDPEAGKITILIKPKRGCLFHPKRVRVNVRTIESGYTQDGRYFENRPQLVDHLPGKNTFTPWVKYSRK